LFSIVSIAVACAWAELLIPEQAYYAQGALFAPSLVLSIGLVSGVVVGGIARPASFLRTESILSFGLVYWITLDPIQGSYGLWGTSLSAVHNVYLGTAIFAVGMWLGSSLPQASERRTSVSLGSEFPPRAIFQLGVVVFLGGMLKPMLACSFNPVCLGEGFFMPWREVPWHSFRLSDSGFGFNTILKYLGFLGFLSLPLAAVMHHLERRNSQRVTILWCFGVVMLLLLIQEGSRRIVGLTVASTALVSILLKPRVSFRRLARLGVVAVGLLVLLEMMVSWRDVGIGAALASGEAIGDASHGILKVDKNFYYLAHAMTVVPEPHPYRTVDGLLWAIGGPIPRSVWPSKPASRGIDLVSIIGDRKQPGFSWSCSAVGDLYLMGGMLAIALGGLMFGLLARACNGFLFMPPTVRSRLFYGFGVMALFVGLRNIKDLMSVGLVVMILILMVLGARRFASGRRRRVAMAT
jgi:hypothetical protein